MRDALTATLAFLSFVFATSHCHFGAGLEAPTVTSDWPTRLEARHFELLIRIMTSLGKMAGTAAERSQFLLTAVHFVNSLWSLTMHTLNTAAAERVRGIPCAGPAAWQSWCLCFLALRVFV